MTLTHDEYWNHIETLAHDIASRVSSSDSYEAQKEIQRAANLYITPVRATSAALVLTYTDNRNEAFENGSICLSVAASSDEVIGVLAHYAMAADLNDAVYNIKVEAS